MSLSKRSNKTSEWRHREEFKSERRGREVQVRAEGADTIPEPPVSLLGFRPPRRNCVPSQEDHCGFTDEKGAIGDMYLPREDHDISADEKNPFLALVMNRKQSTNPAKAEKF